MSDERAFIVEAAQDIQMSFGSQTLPIMAGDRFLVVSVLTPTGPVPEVKLLAHPLTKPGGMVVLDPAYFKFLGFRGDCMLCGTRKPEEP